MFISKVRVIVSFAIALESIVITSYCLNISSYADLIYFMYACSNIQIVLDSASVFMIDL